MFLRLTHVRLLRHLLLLLYHAQLLIRISVVVAPFHTDSIENEINGYISFVQLYGTGKYVHLLPHKVYVSTERYLRPSRSSQLCLPNTSQRLETEPWLSCIDIKILCFCETPKSLCGLSHGIHESRTFSHIWNMHRYGYGLGVYSHLYVIGKPWKMHKDRTISTEVNQALVSNKMGL